MPRAATAVVVAAGIAGFALATDGFRVLTSEGARRHAVARSPRVLPEVLLEDQNGSALRWADLRGQPVLVEFVYTTCPDVCQQMLSEFRALVETASSMGIDDRVHFVSVSFDPERDTVSQLRAVASYYGADGQRWRFARIGDPAALQETLDAFGIVALPAAGGGFEHNAAIHGLDAEGRLARIGDITAAREMLTWADGRSGSE